MTLFSPTTVLVGFLLLYLSSFLIFAIVRIATGISIQRIGYFSLRRIAYVPKEGVQIELRGLGLSLHPPSFAQPTWLSLRLSELKVTVDPAALAKGKRSNNHFDEPDTQSPRDSSSLQEDEDNASLQGRSKMWRTLTRLKEQVKRLHRKIHWLKLVDVVAVNTTVNFVEAGQIQVGTLSLAVDTRQKMVERGKLFRRKKYGSGEQRPAEWIMTVQNVLLAVDGGEPTELLDNIGVNVHGILHKDLDGLRDASIALKIGRMHIPYDDLMILMQRIKHFRQTFSESSKNEADDEVSFADFVEELDKPGSRDDALVQTVADSKEFASSLLRGIQEIQIALSFFRLSRAIQSPSAKQSSVYLNIISHEIGIDLHRMDQNSPAHRMYFQRNDIAHQALLAAISLSVSLDDSSGETDNILYIPMATTTIKTTLPSKTISSLSEWNPEERNTNILFANLVMTSPSIDLEPRHVSRLLGLVQDRTSSPRGKKRNNHRLISRLLPKASIKLSVHEPVLRFVLPVAETSDIPLEDYNLLICSISSISLDIESSHSSEGGVHYSLSSIYRVASHQLYYQTPLGVKHNLLTTENMELKILLSASPEVCVVASGSLNTCSAHMVNGEVNRGIQQVIEQFRAQVKPKKRVSMSLEERKPSIMRRIPPWLLRFQFEATGLSLEIAGVDEVVSEVSRGVSIQLHSWSADYRAQKTEQPNVNVVRRRTPSHSTIGDESPFRFPPTSPPRQTQRGAADGRRLALHIRGFEGFVIESEDYLEAESFFSLPRFEVALSTSSDRLGPILHINSVVKGIYLQYSLYRYYCVGVAASVIQNAFFQRSQETATETPSPWTSPPSSPRPFSQRNELVTADVRVTVIQVKTSLPADPPMMLQIYGLTAGSHRLSVPFVRAHLVRLHAEAPKLKGVWARIIGMNNVRVDLRTAKLKQGAILTEEKSIDVWADFIRLGVPHHMVMHRIFDNVINTSKAFKQLHHRFKTRSAHFDSARDPEEPKKVPRISLRSKALLFEMEDDAFEWKLGCIYRAGLLEQRQRLAREEAYQLKIQKIKECDQRRASSRLRAKSSHRTLRSDRVSGESRRSKSAEAKPRTSGEDDGKRDDSKGGRGRKFRYDPDGAACLSGESKITTEVAWYRLQEYNSRSWKKKIDCALKFQGTSIKEVRNLFSGADEPPEDVEETETVLSIPNRPALMAALISDINLVIDKPSFPMEDCPAFLHKIGKGIPMSTQYALLVPMSFQLDMGEARVNLRDYPLDLLHIPALRPGQSPRLPSWSLRTDFVIAEEYRDYKSARQVQVELVPPGELPDGSRSPPFELGVWRSVSPVKTYSDPTIEINTSLPTSISWGMSYQPVIQDMMKIIESFTKPEIDPSDRVGFWDKIRLSFHSRIRVLWKEDGDVHLRLKGSRDPYVVTGFGSGFVMCWRKDVKWEIHTSDDPQEFMSVTSGEYVLAIPDYSHEARFMAEATAQDLESTSSSSVMKNAAHFKKVVMKLSGEVKLAAGLVFERNIDEDRRSFQFRPHYEVVLQNPKYVDPEREVYDAYHGFRSNHIHLSIAVIAPENRNWSIDYIQPSTSYNTVHLTPRFFTHFFNWWSLFSGVMSLPVRQGPLWPGITKTSKKFNRHLATVKYKLLFAPLFVAHIYKHKDREDYGEDVVTATGLKVRLDSLKLDIHQRREQVKTQAKGRLKQTQASAMRINQAELDLQAADFRAVSASIQGTNLDDIEQNKDDIISSFQQPVPSVDLSRFTIPDNNLDWIDMDDFVELDWILPQESNPRTQILPLAFTPRFTYFRQTDHGDISPDETGYSTFGNEPTHECVISESNEPRRVQMELIRERLAHVETQVQDWERTIGEQELRMAKDVDHVPHLQTEHENYVKQAQSLARRRAFLASALQRLERQLAREERIPTKTSPEHIAADVTNRVGTDAESTNDGKDADMDGLYSSPHDEFATNFNNRFIIHNTQLKWNNSLRNIILRYSHQVSQRRGFVYYMSRRAVKFILDIVDEQSKNQRRHSKLFKSASRRPSDVRGLVDNEEDGSVEDRIEQLLNDAKRFVNAEEQDDPDQKNQASTKSDNSSENISPEFTPQNSYHLRLIAPQIQLQSEKNQKSVVLVAAKGMQLKVVSIMDKERVSDDVSGLVQRRFSLEMDGAQFFVATQKNLMKHLQFYAGNKYGNSPGSAWPPWLTIEAMFDFELNPFGFSRIVQKTSASLRYDKYNNLRLKYTEEVAKGQPDQERGPGAEESRIDQISVEFPHFRAICDSAEYYSMYIIVLDLLLYSEPLEKVRNERLERIMLSSDFSDLRGAPEMVFKLQSRIRHLEEIKEHFQIHAKYLDKKGWEDRLELEKDLSQCEDELFFMMKAITTSQRRIDPTMSGAHGVMRWNISAHEVVWHLMKDESEPLVEFQLRNAEYDRTDNSDGSNHNLVAVERLYGLNLLPEAIYPQIIVPYLDQGKLLDTPDDHMIRVKWHMLEAVAGIPVVDDFEVSLFPLKIQLEHELGQKVFEYIFPNVGPSAFENGGFSPLIIKNMKPLDESDQDSEEESTMPPRSAHDNRDVSTEDLQKGPGAIELRLQPTLTSSEDARPRSARSTHLKGLAVTPTQKDSNRLGPSEPSRQIVRPSTSGGLSTKRSADSLRMLSRQATDKTIANGLSTNVGEDKGKKFGLAKLPNRNAKSKAATDDLSQMMSRASNYMTLAHVKVHDVVLCLSYKGKGDHNLEDIHDFVFRLPILEYRNKTWSNLDLALRLKKDVIKALISHAPAILGNKFSHHRPTKQQKKYRDFASPSQLLHNIDSGTITISDKSQTSQDSNSEYSESQSQRSVHSGSSRLVRSNSLGSSMFSTEQGGLISDARSASEVDVDARWEQSRRIVNPPSRPMTSGTAIARSDTKRWDGADERNRMTIRNFGRKLMPSRK